MEYHKWDRAAYRGVVLGEEMSTERDWIYVYQQGTPSAPETAKVLVRPSTTDEPFVDADILL